MTTDLQTAINLIRDSRHILVLSGAGISKASGIPTYRDTGGLWETGDNLKFSHAASFKENPNGFLDFWAGHRQQMCRARPNPAHFAIKELQTKLPKSTLVTQNVDGLLQQAGCKEVLELHGNMRETRCMHCLPSKGKSLFGRCLRCFSRVRPGVVLFGENLSEEIYQAAKTGACGCDVILVVGTSALVYPAAELPVLAMRFGAKLIVLDPEPMLALAADVVLTGPAEKLLPILFASV